MTEEKGSKSVLRSFRKILDYGSLNPINGKNIIKERNLPGEQRKESKIAG